MLAQTKVSREVNNRLLLMHLLNLIIPCPTDIYMMYRLLYMNHRATYMEESMGIIYAANHRVHSSLNKVSIVAVYYQVTCNYIYKDSN